MEIPKNNKVVLGITGGISAYKSADLTRRLIEAGYEVRVVMTAGACEFVTPLTFQALSGNPVHTELLDTAAEAAMGHIELARWADVVLIAPTSANTLARLAHGLADDLLATICLATEAPLVLAPAMNRIMWSNPATQDNLKLLQSRGVSVLGPGSGSQACGETGAGRMLESIEIRDGLSALLDAGLLEGNRQPSSATSHGHRDDLPLGGVNILITAGPTREQIDPVRFLSNNSSGKMGFALASQAHAMGANVFLIAGPVSLETPQGVHRIDVKSAADMYAAVMRKTDGADIFIAVAAVADYRVADIADQKIKKTDVNLNLELTRNKDILADVAALENSPFCVGFAAETQDIAHYAMDKLERKKLQMIAANPVVQSGKVVFGSDTNSLEVYWPDNGHQRIESAPKIEVARELLELIAVQYRDDKS